MSGQTAAPAGWYPNPGGTGLRWWGGDRWYEHTAASPSAFTGGAAPPIPPPPPAGWRRAADGCWYPPGATPTRPPAPYGVPLQRPTADGNASMRSNPPSVALGVLAVVVLGPIGAVAGGIALLALARTIASGLVPSSWYSSDAVDWAFAGGTEGGGANYLTFMASGMIAYGCWYGIRAALGME